MDDLTKSMEELRPIKEKVVKKFEEFNFPAADKEVNSEQLEPSKILGCGWSGSEQDLLLVMYTWEGPNATTRREWLGQKHSLFDPTGVALEVDMDGRALTRVVAGKYNYDDKMDEADQAAAAAWEERRKLYFKEFRLPRLVDLSEVFVFCDASDLAWAVKLFDKDGKVVSGRGGLWKPEQINKGEEGGWTTPRQELHAMSRAVELVKELKNLLGDSKLTIFSDSSINVWRVRKHIVGKEPGEEPYPAWEARNIGVIKSA